MKIWIAGRSYDAHADFTGIPRWEVLGAYTEKAAALKRCTDRGQDFVAPLTLNEDLPEETLDWVDCEFLKDQPV